MANIVTGYQNADVYGRPAFEVMDSYSQASLLAGGEPGLSEPMRILMASSQVARPQFLVVGLDANKNLVPATTTITPIGVLAHATPAAGASNTTIRGETFLEGVFNVGDDDAGAGSPLVWDASFTTRALKMASVVGNPRLQFRSRLNVA